MVFDWMNALWSVSENVGWKYCGTMDSIIAPSQSGLVSSMFVLIHGRGCDYGPPSLPIECI